VQVVLYAIGALFVLFLLLDFIVMPVYTRQGAERQVPSLLGLSQKKAAAVADSAGFVMVEDPPRPASDDAVGTILEQRPLAGSLAKTGRKIRVIPAIAAERDWAPNLVGLELRDAQLRCRNAGLVSGEGDVQFGFSERVPKGTVMAQRPEAGTPVESGEVIRLIVSLGPLPDRFIVPYLMEKPLHEARTLLRDSGLKLGKIVRKETDLYPAGTVIAQSVRSGEQVQKDSEVDVVVAVPVQK